MNNSDIKKWLTDAIELEGTEQGKSARNKYEMYKMEVERKRNRILFYNTLLLATIALINLVFAFLKYYQKD